MDVGSKVEPMFPIPTVPQHAVAGSSKLFAHPSMSLVPLRSWLADGNWFIGVGAGGLYSNLPSSTTVHNGSAFPAPHDVDLYTTKNQGKIVTEVSAGHRWTTSSHLIPAYSLGVLWQYGFNSNMGNTITQYSEPEFLNYNYNWNAQSNLLLASGKLNVFQYKRFSPFINGGIGASFNLANDYSETALANVTPRVSPDFRSNTASQFAYQLGAGFDLQLTPQILASLGYNYQNLGQVASGYGVSTWSSEKLNLGSSSQNEFLISVHYLFDNNNMKQ